ncbi:DMT family transporter [Lacibacterium aquatile]|uniref:DMT family transporter n=1 Tax=Lacibacterium aquatile TaxID=1168082 RepID=A0ABW5DR36_9PROT
MTALSPKDFALVMLIVVVWGFNFAAAKIGVAVAPPLALLAMRFFIVGILLVPFVRFPRKQIGLVIAISTVLGTVHFGVMFVGLQWVDVATASLIGQLQVPFAVMLGVLVYKEKLGLRQILGMALAFGGLLVVFGKGDATYNWLGVAMISFAALVWASSNLMVKKVTDTSPIGTTAWMSLLAGPQLFALSLIFDDQPVARLLASGWTGAGSIIYMVIGATLIGYGGWYTLMQRVPLSVLSPFMLLVPVCGVLSGVWFLGEPLTWRIVVGGALTILGIGVINVRPRALFKKAGQS